MQVTVDNYIFFIKYQYIQILSLGEIQQL